MPNDKDFELDDLEAFSFDDLSLDDEAPVEAKVDGGDPHGVWVKSAPEDVSEPAPEEQSGLPEEDFLSSEELANLDESFDFVEVSSEAAAEEADDDLTFIDAQDETPPPVATQDDAFDEVSLDDFVSFDDDEAPAEESPAPAKAAAPKAAAPAPAPAPAAPAAEDDDDLGDEFLDIDIDVDDDLSDSDLEIAAGPAGKGSQAPSVLSPDDFSSLDDDLAEFGDFEATPAGSGDLIDQDESGFFEETILDEALPPLDDDGPVTLNLEPDDDTDLDRIKAIEEDLTSGIRDAAPVAAAPPSDRAAEILGKIEEELSSIKLEISALKREVTHLRDTPAAAPSPAVAPAPLPDAEAPPAKGHGFFDEEDDETIALTGDELDNILSTAEISEGTEEGLSLEEDLLNLDAEGNLLDAPAPEAPPAEAEESVTDEEFLAGTSLDLNEPDPFDDEPLGVPDSIELEEGLPEALADDDKEDILADDDFEVAPLPEGVLEGPPPSLEIPVDDEPLMEEGWSQPGDAVVEEEQEVVVDDEAEAAPLPPPPPAPVAAAASAGTMPAGLKDELRAVLAYMDKLLASLPDEKIQEFAESEHFEVYKRLFEELGLIE